MRASGFIGQAAAFAIMVALVWGGGRWLVERELPETTVSQSDPDDDMGALFDEDGNLLPPEESAPEPPPEPAAGEPGGTAATELERVAPREPLGDLGQASTPPPPPPTEQGGWQPTVMYKPVAVAAGRIESMGYQVALAGANVVEADESCSYQGADWDCGIRARTAFRSLLRGRAPTCTVPPEPGTEAIQADCRIGSQDLAAWLVENGWARATPGGPYVEAGARAEKELRGIFGPPPDTSLPLAAERVPSLLGDPGAPATAYEDDFGQEAGAVPILPGEFPPAPKPPAVQTVPAQ